MKSNKANTQLGVTFNVVEFEDSDILSLISDPAKLARITDCVNADRRQKIALVDARYDLSEKLAKEYGFARKTKDVSVDGTTTQVHDETEGAHIKRFTDAIADGSHEVSGFTPPSGDAKVKENAALVFLQSVADACGVYTLNLDKAVRKAGTGLIPKWALEAASTIIKNGNQAAWVAKFASGYTNNKGIVIDPIVHGDFQQVATSGTAEAIEAVNQSNVKNLAKAITEVRRQENEKTQVEFV
jgi:hypothetical protein